MLIVVPIPDILQTCSFTEAWPASQTPAAKVVTNERRNRKEEGRSMAETEAWNPSELILATTARIPVIRGSVFAFKMAFQQLADLIWSPTELKDAFSSRARGGGTS